MGNIKFDENKHPKFKTQYDKIVTAYLKNELNPWVCTNCFVGNLLNNKNGWGTGYYIGGPSENQEMEIWNKKVIDDESNGLYTPEEISLIEANFLFGGNQRGKRPSGLNPVLTDYEETLYKAMERGLIFLKEVHESKGEVVENYSFQKRELKLEEV